MMASPRNKALGRGLSALLGEGPTTEEGVTARSAREISVDQLRPGRFQPRREMDETSIEELARSIEENGILQPILARQVEGTPGYEIIAGERRWRAAQKAGLHEVPVLVRDLDDRQTLEVALVENLQREDLSPVEEAEAYLRLTKDFYYSQEKLATHLGKSRSHIANTMRLLSLPKNLQRMISEGIISAGHGRAMLSVADPMALAKTVVEKNLNVRQTEALARRQHKNKPASRSAGEKPGKDTDTLALERELTDSLGLKVTIDFDGNGGRLSVQYGSLEQLDDLIARLSAS